MLIVFGVQAFQSIMMLADAREQHPEFCIPMTMIPATISNNVPGTDFTLGTDTALNAICDVSLIVFITSVFIILLQTAVVSFLTRESYCNFVHLFINLSVRQDQLR